MGLCAVSQGQSPPLTLRIYLREVAPAQHTAVFLVFSRLLFCHCYALRGAVIKCHSMTIVILSLWQLTGMLPALDNQLLGLGPHGGSHTHGSSTRSGNFDIILDPFGPFWTISPAFFSGAYACTTPPLAVQHSTWVLSAYADRVLAGACNTMVCRIRVLRRCVTQTVGSSPCSSITTLPSSGS